MSLAGYIFIKMCEKADKKRDAGLTIPDDVEYVRDIRYGRNKKYHELDICWPIEAKPRKKYPLIISIHGGGYVYGTKEVYQFYAASLAEKGFAVVNFNYRLAPKYKFPAPLEDLERVILWLLKNEKDYPIDLDNVYLVGDSAGAQLASQYGVIYSSPEYRKIMDFRKPKIKIRALGLCCGLYDLREELATTGLKGTLKDYLGSSIEKYGEKLDILDYITKDYPPAYIFSAKGDFLKDKCEPMEELLRSRGVKCKSKIYGNKDTGHVFYVDMRNKVGQEANDDMVAFFRKF